MNAPITTDRACEIIAEVFGEHPFSDCPVIDEDGDLNDGTVCEPADLSSEEAFRAQLQAWWGE
jgi:hypothetical protein